MTDLRLHIPELFQGGWKHQIFKPFRDGVEICQLHDGSATPARAQGSGDGLSMPEQPSVALLRYAAGASVPRHRHVGIETIFVLDGSQSDENGVYASGSLVVNPVGSEHAVWSDNGCVVLIQWDLPVQFL